jgi:ubiquinone biosynthesis protein
MDNVKKLKRTAQLAAVLTGYGFEALVTQTGIKKLVPDNFIEKSEKRKEIFSMSVYERIRLVLEELGPAYIKLGQLLSNRDDILPEGMTAELQKLQDNVPPQDIDIYATLKKELSILPEDIFEEINSEPIAAASLSQVYTATLKDGGKKVIIKVKRKGILKIIEADILIMKDFAQMLERYDEAARKIGLCSIVSTFEKSIMSELSFVHELDNMERFRANFAGNEHVYVPETYPELSNANILCMEFIDGIKISDKNKLIECGLDPGQLASTVVDLYLKQVIEYGFFHADPHSGNIFVRPNNQIVFIDYGSVGQMLPQDREHLGDFIIYAIRKDTKRLIRVIKKISVAYSISNENSLERDLYYFLDMLEHSSIKELDMTVVSKQFAKILNENHTVLPEYIYLLIRGIVLLEGIGRELGVETNIMENVKPYGIKLLKKRLAPEYISKKVVDKAYDTVDKLNELPESAHSLIQKINDNQLEMTHNIKGLSGVKKGINRMAASILISAMVIASALLILAKMPPLIWGVSALGLAGLIFSGFAAAILVLLIIRDSH